MNSIRQIQALNQKELDSAVYASRIPYLPAPALILPLTIFLNRSPEASWHADYRDTAYIYIGGLPFDLSEGDILTIFSQFGEPVHLNLVRDKETGKSRGFAFLKYEDQRSTDLAVDNLGGATVMGRLLRVDHTRYKRREGEGLEDNLAAVEDGEEDKERDTAGRSRKQKPESESDGEKQRKPRALLKEEQELDRIVEEHDDEDPMKEYLVKEKKEEVERALKKAKSTKHRETSEERRERHRHRRHHHHRHRRTDEDRSGSRDKRSPRRRSRSRSKERRQHREKRDRSKRTTEQLKD